MLRETACSKKSHFDWQIRQKDRFSIPANIQYSRSRTWFPACILPSQKVTKQAALLSCSLTRARSPAGAHIIQRLCETTHKVSKLLKLASWQEKYESSSELQHFQHQGNTRKAETFRRALYILEHFARWESYWPNFLPCAQ